MKRTIDKDSRNVTIISMINSGVTWETLEDKFMLTRAYMQQCLKAYFGENEKEYKLLLTTARANSNGKVIYITETGVLVSEPDFLKNKKRVFVPNWCQGEIKSLQFNLQEDYSEILQSPKICWTNIPTERIRTIPGRYVKHRTLGIAAFCCAMAKRNKGVTIKLYTNSRAIIELVKFQQISNIDVVKR